MTTRALANSRHSTIHKGGVRTFHEGHARFTVIIGQCGPEEAIPFGEGIPTNLEGSDQGRINLPAVVGLEPQLAQRRERCEIPAWCAGNRSLPWGARDKERSWCFAECRTDRLPRATVCLQRRGVLRYCRGCNRGPAGRRRFRECGRRPPRHPERVAE